jgi:hypothetical protein
MREEHATWETIAQTLRVGTATVRRALARDDEREDVATA